MVTTAVVAISLTARTARGLARALAVANRTDSCLAARRLPATIRGAGTGRRERNLGVQSAGGHGVFGTEQSPGVGLVTKK